MSHPTSLVKNIMSKPKGKVIEGVFGKDFGVWLSYSLLYNSFIGP